MGPTESGLTRNLIKIRRKVMMVLLAATTFLLAIVLGKPAKKSKKANNE